MELNATYGASYSNSSPNQNVRQIEAQVYTGLAIAHLSLVVIPSLVLSAIVLHNLYRQCKASGVKPVALLYAILAITCATGPTSYGIPMDVTLLTYFQTPGYSTLPCSAYIVAYTALYFVLHMVICFSIGMIAVVQFMVLHLQYKPIVKVGRLLVAFVAITLVSVCVNCVLLSVKCMKEAAHDSNWRLYKSSDAIVATAWAAIVVIPLFATVVFSCLTCLKVNKDVLKENKSVVRSVIWINSLNIVSNVVSRLCALLIYFASTDIASTQSSFFMWTLVAMYVVELVYPLTLFSIFFLHNRKQMSCNCFTAVCVEPFSIQRKAEESSLRSN